MDFLYGGIEQIFDKMGMMRGQFAEIKRFTFGMVLTFGILYVVKPPIMFDDKGSLKPWNILVIGSEEEKNSTILPIWLAALIGGALPSLIV